MLYSETTRRNKWTTREIEKATVQERDGIICISEEISSSQNELLSRSVCLLASLGNSKIPRRYQIFGVGSAAHGSRFTEWTFMRWDKIDFSSSSHQRQLLNTPWEATGVGNITDSDYIGWHRQWDRSLAMQQSNRSGLDWSDSLWNYGHETCSKKPEINTEDG